MPRHIRSAWLKTLATVAAVLLFSGLVGWFTGHLWLCIALGALATLAWHYWRLRSVLRRLTARQRWDTAEEGTGVWNELDRLLYRNQVEMRVRKRRLLDMLRSYRAAAAALPDAVVVLDRNSQRVQWFNEAATALLGLHHPGDLGEALVERLQPMPLAHWLAGGRNAEPILDVPSPVDPAIRLNLRLIPYSSDYWLLIARDVSKLLRLEQVRRDFVANVSHELRTPLTVVHGYLDMMDPEDFPGTGPMLEEMRKQSQRMAQLVEDLLTLSRLESQEHSEEETVAMQPMLATLRREAEAHSQGRHQISIDDQAGVDLQGSTKELHSAFSNLVTNAVRYTPAGGRIAVEFRREGDGAVLAVRDSGYGIPATHLPRLTERFYRVSSSRSRESGGTGLGLSIVKHILGLHHARLEIESEVGKGSVFSCHFDADHVRPRESAPLTSIEE
ncbi:MULTISPECIES: phosphate regulon sensor histidine kinase PhoR [Stenotrophomonas]|uniref:Phosphate regulon sensor protein PhoR n=2 Tax=Bacteria TaxID=2 RepID=A0A2J0SQE7_STEMA|nr:MULTISPECIES: phosphate regulon sensor histidine kinase PhoR [Stenotrophomonas]MBA0309908.1 phosphate regulon sensor histidine kinase PhoR [Stenotrophomonas maltophilia]MBH1411144.1 phosphate regulon sensor histidine kinase PhoR [Stenotrophomonas maltophilia]MBH1865350.1 phosphate regulon sensor histidine kinase PhoR [Stenotrophomonas maltophilia]MDH1389842.1 phosphate regulon sensor histidine kinase PhoR [Stenotrophomonas sp. GD03701]MDH1393852.1 phosphate regulon sensor histidine kinase P